MPSLTDEYRQQYRWRAWESVYASLPDLPGQTILDLGCAIGDQTRDLATHGHHVIGIDGNAELLEAARQEGGARVEYLQGDLHDLTPLSLPRVDGLWIAFTAAYFPDLAGQLRRWCEHLRPGGWVALLEADDIMSHTPLDEPAQDVVRRYYAEALRRGVHDFRMGSRLRDEAVAAGLTVEHERVVPDRELAFQGPATPDVLDAWRRRLDRLRLLDEICGEGVAGFRARFLACLADAQHRSHARVNLVLARSPATPPPP
jgi:SAM-dependent methyltransferase